jgi:hypothetical protein
MTTPTPIPAETTEPNQPTSPTDKDPQAKSKSKRKISGPSPNAPHEELNVTIRNHVGSWTYFSVELYVFMFSLLFFSFILSGVRPGYISR